MVFLVPIAVSLLAIAFLRVLMKLWLNRYVLPLPPGPKGLPILGNVSDMPKPGVLECHHWFEHKKKYGPISSVTAMGQTIVIINDATIALDLLRGRSAIYSSRPSLTFASDMVGWRHVTAMIPYSDTWKIHRRNIKNITSTATSLAEFDRIQETETAHFLANLLEAPERLLDHIRYETGSVILKIVYGYDYNRHEGDPLVDMAETTVAQFAEALVPGRKTAQAMSDQLIRCVNQPYGFVKQQMHEESQTPSFLSQCIATIGTDADMEFIHKWTALALYLGGADTTVSALSTFFLAMSLFPSIQVAAQSELDTVLGVPPRLPTAQDLPRLPYIEAVVKETLRWHQAFMHNPSTYRDPFIFRPERFLGPEAESDPRSHVFGYRRRICPGKYMAERALKVTIANTLVVFRLLSHPSPFKCSIRARSGVNEVVVRGLKERVMGTGGRQGPRAETRLWHGS
ncbi:O-methylsterigmatocystin oxidoreductase [Bipolaris maydis]|nr:O-methylsterigmatocystin oxidoreductase [Bipolaris maydis]KAJ6200021.1 O-methylsterigmatocystin oxidoreductase [Bipolaris maydis]